MLGKKVGPDNDTVASLVFKIPGARKAAKLFNPDSNIDLRLQMLDELEKVKGNRAQYNATKKYYEDLMAEQDRVAEGIKNGNPPKDQSKGGKGKGNGDPLGTLSSDSEAVNNKTDSTRKKHNDNVDGVADRGKNRFELLTKAFESRDKQKELNEKQNQNFAKDGRYGNLNNASFDDTLEASRDADAINNRNKFGHNYRLMAGVAGAGQVSPGFNFVDPIKGDIETQEMRQMRANEQLDAAQRSKDVDLQAAVQKLDYDAFTKEMENTYGIEMSAKQAQIAMEAELERQNLMHFLQKDKSKFDALLKETVNHRYIGMVKNLLESNDTVTASMLCYMLTGMAAPSQDAYLMNEYGMHYAATMKQYGIDTRDLYKLSNNHNQSFINSMAGF